MNNVSESLMKLREKNLLQDVDLELLRFFKAREQHLSREVQLVIGMVSYLFRQGDVCLLLEEYAGKPMFSDAEEQAPVAPPLREWKAALGECKQVGKPGDFKPFILDEAGRFYMHKLWYYEKTLADNLLRRSETVYEVDTEWLKEVLDRLFPASGASVDWQKIAAALALRHQLAVISGGPGTGKTSTVVRILTLLLEHAESTQQPVKIALSAPTGKAAARLTESILSAKESIDTTEEIRESIPGEAVTLHQLLGARRESSSFRHNEDHPIPYDVVVIDEASMVDQTLMSKLCAALLPDTRLILLGDKDQLASVEAGSVLGDICAVDQNQLSEKTVQWLKQLSIDIPSSGVQAPTSLTDNIILLTHSYRFGPESGIAQLAENINRGEPAASLEVLGSIDYSDVSLIEVESNSEFKAVLKPKVTDYYHQIRNAASKQAALEALRQFQILSAHRHGSAGVIQLNKYVEHLLNEEQLIPKHTKWYAGRPVMITVNDYTLDLYNGDIGICLPDEEGRLKVFFGEQESVRAFAPARLPEHETAYAMTVHKSQGSEYEEVLLILPNKKSKVLSRELLYTAVTRARTKLVIAGSKNSFKKGVEREISRLSGLRGHLWAK